MKKLGSLPLLIVCAAVSALTLGIGAHAAAASSTSQLRGTFTIQFPKGHPASNAPCPPGEFCGVGSLAGVGPATITILDEIFSPLTDSSCFAVTRVEQIDLLEGTGSLVIESNGTFCRPGGSGDSHASPSSYGGPGRWDLAFVVDGLQSTGIFADASGGGTETMAANGGIGVWHLSGTIIRA
jgi:hypothetical protein